MLEALCADPLDRGERHPAARADGQSAVQLAARTRKPAQNLAQFLRKHERWDWDSGAYYIAPKAPRFQGAKTVVIDEASMLTEEMLAATIDALGGVDRLILCGDPRQLAADRRRPAVCRPRRTPARRARDGRRGRRAAHRPAPGRRGRRLRNDAGRCRGRLAVLARRRRSSVPRKRSRVFSRATATAASRSSSWDDEADLHRKVVEPLGAERGPWARQPHARRDLPLVRRRVRRRWAPAVPLGLGGRGSRELAATQPSARASGRRRRTQRARARGHGEARTSRWRGAPGASRRRWVPTR